jgi:hypothetical protein
MNPCTIINTGKHYSFYVKREVEGNGCEKSFSWNGARWESEEVDEYLPLGLYQPCDWYQVKRIRNLRLTAKEVNPNRRSNGR